MDGKRNGKGKKYSHTNGELIFEGEYLNGHRLKGKDYIKGMLEYEGEYLFNKKWNGKGFDKYGNIIYELINGTGTVKEYNFYNFNLEFEGELLNGERSGKGKEYDYSGKLIYEGEYLKGEKITKKFIECLIV